MFRLVEVSLGRLLIHEFETAFPKRDRTGLELRKMLPANALGLEAKESIVTKRVALGGAGVKVQTLTPKRVNALHREIDRRAFFVYTQENTTNCEFFKAGSHDSLRSLFKERFPECKCNLQGCARECEKSVSNSLTLCFRWAPELTQSFHSEPRRKRVRTGLTRSLYRGNKSPRRNAGLA